MGKAVADGWVPGETLFDIDEACQRGTIIQYLLSDAAQIEVWPTVKKNLTPVKHFTSLTVRYYLQRAAQVLFLLLM